MSNTIAFDDRFYASQNPDVVAAISRGTFTSFAQHYDLFGRFEGRNPNAFFNTSFYLSQYPDVATARVNPLTHFLNSGAAEGRFANATEKAAIDVNNNGGADDFNEAAYRTAYSDVDAAIKAGTFKNAYQHFVQFGQFEGRTATLSNGTTLTGPFTNTGTPVNAGTTFTLTDKLDSFTTVANGTVKGVISSNAADTTFGVADTISGGTANSKFDLTAVVGSTDVSTAGRTTSGIETFNIAFVDADTTAGKGLVVDASTLTGAKTFNIASATASTGDSVSFTGLAKTQSVQISSTDNDLGVNLAYKSGEDTGTADTASVSLNGAKVGAVSVTGNFETIAVSGTGTSEVASLAAGGVATSVTIGGAGATTINSITGLSTTASAVAIDASKATGAVTVGVNLASNLTVTGGSASDTLIATNTASTTIASTFKSAGVETILFAENGTGSAATSSIDLTNSTGVTTVGLRGSAATNADSVTFNNVAAGTSVLLQGGKTAANQTIGSVTTTFTGATSAAPAAALTVNVNNQGLDTGVTGTVENVISAGTVTADNVKAVTINASDADVSSFTLAASTLETLTVKATEDFVFAGTVGATATTTAIDATGVVGKAQFTLTDALTKSVAVTTGGGDDNLNLGAQNANGTADSTFTVSTGAGKDTVTAGSFTNKAVLKLDLGAGDDTFNVTAGSNISTAKGHSIAFGDGVDTLRLDGASANLTGVSFTGLEKILLTGAGDLSLQAASLNGAAIELTTIGAGRVIATGTGNADTIDLSKLTVVGPNGVNVNGGAGNDTITLTSGKDSVIFADTAANNGSDTIRSFTSGSTGDVLNVKAFIGATLDTTGGAGDVSTLGVNLNNDLNLSANSANVVLGYNTAGTLTSSLIVGTGTATNGEIIIADGYKGFVAVATGATATSANLYYVEDTDGGAGVTGAATLVGVLNVATGTVSGLTADNFVTN